MRGCFCSCIISTRKPLLVAAAVQSLYICHSMCVCAVFFYISSLLQSLEHWEEVYAVLEGETLSLFQDQEAVAQVDFIHVWINLQCERVANELAKLLKWCRCLCHTLCMVFGQRSSRWPPISLAGALCSENLRYRRKENTFRLT